MRTKKTAPENVDEYISTFPVEIQKILNRIRKIIKKTAPGSEETISYQIPTAKLNGSFLIYFAAYKNHIGLYPSPEVTGELVGEIAVYESGKGSIKFPLTGPIPFDLIERIVVCAVMDNLKRSGGKVSKKGK